MFKKILFAISLYLSSAHATSGSLSTPPTAIPGSGAAGIVVDFYEADLFSCYNSQMNQTIFSWTDYQTNYPYYAVYDCGSATFTTDATLINASYVFGDVYCCYNAHTNQVFFCWIDQQYHHPQYAIYNCTTGQMSSTAAIDTVLTGGNNVYSCYNSQNNQIVFSWSDNTTFYPYYAVYDCTNQTIQTPIKISTSSKANLDVYCSYNTHMNQIAFTWAEETSKTSPIFIIYDFTTNQFITSPTELSSEANVSTPFSCYNSQMNQWIFCWENDYIVSYGIYNCNTNSLTTSNPIPNSHALDYFAIPFVSYNSQMNQAIFSWSNKDQFPTYAIYNCKRGVFTTPPTILSSTKLSLNSVTSSYNNQMNQVTFNYVRRDQNNHSRLGRPYYAIYTQPIQNMPTSMLHNKVFSISSYTRQKGVY